MSDSVTQGYLLPRHVEAPGCVWKEGMVGPSCRPPSALRKAAMIGRDSYYEMETYSRITTWLLLALVATTILPGLIHRARVWRPKLASKVHAIPLYTTLAAFLRYFGYRPLSLNLRLPGLRAQHYDLPPLGSTIVMTAFVIGTLAWCFAVRPWYRPAEVWGSTPLGVRSGMIANAFVPFLFVFAFKVNPITWLSGISHERLQVFHQWIARLFLLFSLIHSFAFLYQPLADGGASNLKAWFYYDRIWWQGCVAVAVLVWLVASSTRIFRNMSYEFFIFQHIFSICVFLGFYFIHTRDLLNSWAWLWAAVAPWGFSVVVRWLSSLNASGFVGKTAVVESRVEADEGVVRVSLRTNARWAPAQHCFVRFPTIGVLAPFQSHPFTIATLPSPSYKQSEIVLIARVQGGLTRTLLDMARSGGDVESDTLFDQSEESKSAKLAGESDQPLLRTRVLKMRAMVDGPYGANGSCASFASVLLVAGGSGASFVLPILGDIALRAARGQVETKDVELVWSVRHADLTTWYMEQLQAASDTLAASGVRLRVSLHVTSSDSASQLGGFTVSAVRPDTLAHVQGAVRRASKESLASLAVVVCGPKGMSDDVAKAASAAQWDILKRSTGALREVYLINESFSW